VPLTQGGISTEELGTITYFSGIFHTHSQILVTERLRVKNVNVFTVCTEATKKLPVDKNVLDQEDVDICRVRELVKEIVELLINVLEGQDASVVVDT
jgi:hypothetical protein